MFASILNYFTEDPMRALYVLGGGGGLMFWVDRWSNRRRVQVYQKSETYDPKNGRISAELRFELINLGTLPTSVNQDIQVSMLSPDAKPQSMIMKITNKDRQLASHKPVEICARGSFEGDFAFTWYRTYQFTFSSGRDTKVRVRNSGRQHLSRLRFFFEFMLFRVGIVRDDRLRSQNH